jgi:hypothetical protein
MPTSRPNSDNESSSSALTQQRPEHLLRPHRTQPFDTIGALVLRDDGDDGDDGVFTYGADAFANLEIGSRPCSSHTGRSRPRFTAGQPSICPWSSYRIAIS